ncbi:DUF4114 domain-containing protein [Spongiivirga sp. MCCC 1A20706]|uniref:DUF4114 domain-containing protein n=1 Tax=Spongiivirga sp. MCCC 1A20706 TaxID=3160963 RepID=UPI0039773F8B
MKTVKILFKIVLIIGFLSCSTEENTAELIEAPIDENPFSVNNDRNELTKRLRFINRTATIKPVVKTKTGKFSTAKVNGAQENYFWEHVAEVDPLVLGGFTLSATHITLADDKAYVSYHKQGDLHKGAVEIIDLSNPNFPEIISQVYFNNADVNALTSDFEGSNSLRKIWTAMSDNVHGAQLFELTTTNGQFNSDFKRVNLSNVFENSGVSASANGIASTDNYIYITSGKTHGGTVILNKDNLNALDHEVYANAKYLALNSDNSKVASLITGDEAFIRVADVNDALNTTSFPIGSIFHQNVVETYRGKSTMEFSPIHSNQLYVAKGKYGLANVDVNSGTILNESEGLMLVVGNTNGITTDNDYIYMANGADGIAIAKHPTVEGEEINPVFFWDMQEDDASANFIMADGEWVFVAKGGGGFKILRKREKDEYKTVTTYDEKGVPDGMEEDVEVCSTLLPNIYQNVLPERQNAMQAHPEYFTNPVKELYISEETDLYLTFIDEGAGYKNVLGYYTYNQDNPPASVNDLDKTVIFPNASAQGSGGGLIRGNTMRLLGSFESGTVVGFFLIANGWRNGSITDGYYSQHTDINFNLSGRQQSILFYDQTCQSTVIAFEDISVPNGDNDFNDAIFQIEASNPNAIDTSSFNQIGQ